MYVSGDDWDATFGFHILEKLGMKSLSGDPSLYIKQENERTDGLLGIYADDCLFASHDSFINCIKKTQDEFESKPVKRDDVEFSGVRMNLSTTIHRQVARTNPDTYIRHIPIHSSSIIMDVSLAT